MAYCKLYINAIKFMKIACNLTQNRQKTEKRRKMKN